MTELRFVLDIKDVTEEQVIAAGPVFRVTGQGGFDVEAEPVALGHPERLDSAAAIGYGGGRWWITTGIISEGGEKILGPFATQDRTLEVRATLERFTGPRTFWVDQDAA